MGWTRGKKRQEAVKNEAGESTIIDGHRARIITKMIKCGKEGCKKCPHGPYRYLVFRVEKRLPGIPWRKTTKLKTIYLGKA